LKTKDAPTFTLYLDDAAHKAVQAVLASWTKELKQELAEKINRMQISEKNTEKRMEKTWKNPGEP